MKYFSLTAWSSGFSITFLHHHDILLKCSVNCTRFGHLWGKEKRGNNKESWLETFTQVNIQLGSLKSCIVCSWDVYLASSHCLTTGIEDYIVNTPSCKMYAWQTESTFATLNCQLSYPANILFAIWYHLEILNELKYILGNISAMPRRWKQSIAHRTLHFRLYSLLPCSQH